MAYSQECLVFFIYHLLFLHQHGQFATSVLGNIMVYIMFDVIDKNNCKDQNIG